MSNAGFAGHAASSPQMPVQESGLGAGTQSGYKQATTYVPVSGGGAGSQGGFTAVQKPTGNAPTSFPTGKNQPYGPAKGGRPLAPGKTPKSPYGSTSGRG